METRFGADRMIFDSFTFMEGLRGSLLDENGMIGIDIGENALACLFVPACAADAPGGDTSAYLLFDLVHPTKEFHAAFGSAVAASVVPLPAPFALLLVSLGILHLRPQRTKTA